MKPLCIVLQLILLTAGAYLAVGMAYQHLFYTSGPDILYPDPRTRNMTGPETGGKSAALEKKYADIVEKNLFGVRTRKPAGLQDAPAEPADKPLEKTRLQLALWGTVTTDSAAGDWAVIENKKTREQSLFQVGDPVEDGAVIVQIARNQVILRVNGQNQLLEVDLTQAPASPAPSFRAQGETDAQEIETGPPPLETAETGLPALMKQVRVRPFFSDGKPDGLLLYGIRNDSVFQQAGLRNGDIVKSVNGGDTLSAQDAVTVFQSVGAAMESLSDIRFTILRRGKLQEIVYSAQDNDYTVETVPDE
jgi:general secretion pathway protein C